MRKGIRRILLLLLLLFTPFVLPDLSRATFSITSQFAIQELTQAYDLNTMYIRHNLSGFTSCGCSDCSYFVLRDTATGADDYKQKVPLLLAAFMGGKNVQIGYDNAGGSNCYANNPKVSVIYVQGP